MHNAGIEPATFRALIWLWGERDNRYTNRAHTRRLLGGTSMGWVENKGFSISHTQILVVDEAADKEIGGGE